MARGEAELFSSYPAERRSYSPPIPQRGGALCTRSKMAAFRGLTRMWRQRLSSGIPARRALWEGQSRTKGAPEAGEPDATVKQESVLVCLRPRSKKYHPPEDLQSRLESHIRDVFGSLVSKDWQDISLEDGRLKYRLLTQLAVDLGHAVPNSQLHKMKNVNDILVFYSIPVKDISKFDELSTQELPSNLRIKWQY